MEGEAGDEQEERGKRTRLLAAALATLWLCFATPRAAPPGPDHKPSPARPCPEKRLIIQRCIFFPYSHVLLLQQYNINFKLFVPENKCESCFGPSNKE